jgi:hypothetical protein
LHGHSKRADKPLVRFNAAAIPGELAEAELFGHVKGAFTGATQSRTGYFQQADKGTLFIDEVGELALSRFRRSSFARCSQARSSPSAAAPSTSTSGSSQPRTGT